MAKACSRTASKDSCREGGKTLRKEILDWEVWRRKRPPCGILIGLGRLLGADWSIGLEDIGVFRECFLTTLMASSKMDSRLSF